MSTNEIRSIKNINKKDSKNSLFINDNPDYSLNLYHLIEKIMTYKNEESQRKDNEYNLNLLLMSSKLSKSNKLSCLLLLYYLYQQGNKSNQLLNYLFFKICKLCQKIDILQEEIVQKFLTFPESPNFVYSLEYLSEIKKIFPTDNKLNSNYKSLINTLQISVDEKMKLYLEENSYKFNSFDLMTDEQLNKIKEILDQLFNGNYIINDTDTPLYLIDKIWLYKMKTYIEPYILARKEKLVNLLSEGAFNYEKVLNLMKRKDKLDIFENPCGVIFPGPINNFGLCYFKDYWYDPVNLEENDIIKSGLKLNENYYLVKNDDYILLKSIFKDSNELKRKKFNDEICNFKVVIIEPRLADENYKYLLKKRNLQININGEVNELKNKIIRCLNYEIDKNKKDINLDDNYYNNLYQNNDVDFFVLKKKNKELLIELFIALVNKSKTYESLFLQKINLDDKENCIKDLFNYFDKDSQILIAEIIPKNNFNFITPIISEYKNSNIFNCSVCGEQLNLREKYNCPLCNLSFYCSYQCANISGEHINLHESLYKLYIKKFDIKNFLNEKIDLYKENAKDIVAFEKDKINNYSAINSIIHCLSNSTDLTKFFLSQKYLNDLNITDFLLNKTTFASYYNELLLKIWNNEGDEKLEKYHHNIINYLLKKLDCDPNDKSSINNVREIITRILIDLDKELTRTNNSSIISDLFKGIYQTTFSCSKCGNVSIIYDFFKYLLLPIPKKNSNLNIKYFSEFECKIIEYTYDDNSDIKELKDKATNYLSDKINHIVQMMSVTDLIEITAFDTDDEKILTDIAMYNSIELVQFDKNKIITKIYLTDKKENLDKNEKEKNEDNNNNESDLKLPINKIYKDNDVELVFYERSVFQEPCVNIYIYPFNYNEKEKFNVNKDKLYHVYPIALPVNLSLILENFEYYVNVKLRCLLLDYYKDESEKEKSNYIELVYPHYFCNSQLATSTCFLCKEKTKNTLFCPLFASIDKDQTIKDLLQKFEYPKQPIILLGKCKYYDTNKKYYSNMISFPNKKENKKPIENKLNLYNCFQLYTKKETLEDIDWFCEACNSIQICEKQLTIYNLPIYLIIQIDRFAIKKLNSKNNVDNTFLSIPINNLNLTKYVEGPEKNKTKFIYNLYAIIYKDISSRNEFTYCTCKNGNKWFSFKDGKIQVAGELINKNVHFLFYKREDAQQ